MSYKILVRTIVLNNKQEYVAVSTSVLDFDNKDEANDAYAKLVGPNRLKKEYIQEHCTALY